MNKVQVTEKCTTDEEPFAPHPDKTEPTLHGQESGHAERGHTKLLRFPEPLYLGSIYQEERT